MVLFLERVADGSGLLAPQSRALKLPAGWTVVNHPLDSLADATTPAGQVTGYLELVPPAPTVPLPVPIPATVTTSSAPTTLATIPVPVGGNVNLWLRLIATLAPGQVNANLGPAVYRIETFAGRVGSGAATAGLTKDTSDVSPPFVASVGGATAPGAASFNFSGNNLLVQATGFAVTEAWTSGHTYTRGDGSTTPGQFVTANGNVYLCTTSGTASGSAPSGTGTGLGTGAVFAFVCTGTTVPVQWSGQYTTQVG